MLVSLVSSLYKYCLLPKGEKIGPRRPNEPLAGHGASGTNFFDRQGLRASLTQTLKNEEPSRAPPENALAFYKFSFFLFSNTFGLDSYLSQPHFYLFSESIFYSLIKPPYFGNFLIETKIIMRLVNHITSKIL